MHMDEEVLDHDLDCAPEEDDWDDWEEDSPSEVICLFCEKTLPNADQVLKHCTSDHNFDIRRFCPDREQLSYIRLINYLRRRKPQPNDLKADSQPWLDDDEFLRPVDIDDPMLQFDVDDLEWHASNGCGGDSATAFNENDALLVKLREAESRSVEAEKRSASVLEDLERMRSVAQTFMFSGSQGPSTPIQALTKEEDSGYVQPYGHYSIHQEMLQDKVRTSSYGDFILQNGKLFKDKVVLDIGCGTGILSLFAAKAGARKVFAVDHSDIHIQARDIVHENGYGDIITILHGKLEDIELPVDEVDIIVSEWMGYFLLFESMLDTIIFARDKWLKADGCVYPDQFTISLVALGDGKIHERNVQYWDDVYGFKMSCMRELVVREAAVEVVKQEDVVSEPAIVKTIDAHTVALNECDFRNDFQLKITKSGQITAIVGYFDTIFAKNAETVVRFSTGPDSETTHWKQTIFLVSPPLEVTEGQSVEGSIICRKNPQDPRSLKVALTLNGETRKYVVE